MTFHINDVVMLDDFTAKMFFAEFAGQELVVVTVSEHVLNVRKPDGLTLTATHNCFVLVRSGKKA